MAPRITQLQARRLALHRSGLLKPEWGDFPKTRARSGDAQRELALRWVQAMAYLQLDTISIAGARSHSLVLHSRVPWLEPSVVEELLRPGHDVFEYWGHEACWMPLELYPAFHFRRQRMTEDPWWGKALEEHPHLIDEVLDMARQQGGIVSGDLSEPGRTGWWNRSAAKRVAHGLWSRGDLAIRERKDFRRTYDLAARVIPAKYRRPRWGLKRSLRHLLLLALEIQGWAETRTLAQTWRLRHLRTEIRETLDALVAEGEVVACEVQLAEKRLSGWIRPADLELCSRLARLRPRPDEGRLLSPFDPVLWDRLRVQQLFDFEQVLEVYKPQPQRIYGYYCLPVLAGDRLVGRIDPKAERKQGRLRVLKTWYGRDRGDHGRPTAVQARAVTTAVEDWASALQLEVNPHDY